MEMAQLPGDLYRLIFLRLLPPGLSPKDRWQARKEVARLCTADRRTLMACQAGLWQALLARDYSPSRYRGLSPKEEYELLSYVELVGEPKAFRAALKAGKKDWLASLAGARPIYEQYGRLLSDRMSKEEQAEFIVRLVENDELAILNDLALTGRLSDLLDYIDKSQLLSDIVSAANEDDPGFLVPVIEASGWTSEDFDPAIAAARLRGYREMEDYLLDGQVALYFEPFEE